CCACAPAARPRGRHILLAGRGAGGGRPSWDSPPARPNHRGGEKRQTMSGSKRPLPPHVRAPPAPSCGSVPGAKNTAGQWYEWRVDPEDQDQGQAAGGEPIGVMVHVDASGRRAAYLEPDGGPYPRGDEGYADAARLNWGLVDEVTELGYERPPL